VAHLDLTPGGRAIPCQDYRTVKSGNFSNIGTTSRLALATYRIHGDAIPLFQTEEEVE
jgi:hypothetical protein